MERSKETKNESGPDKQFSLSKDELLKFIELDLWGRFQNNLWKIVGIFLTVISLAGIFGIPYYINNELNNRLSKIETEFLSKEKAIISYSKLLNILSVIYQGKRQEVSNEATILREKIIKIRVDSSKNDWPKQDLLSTLTSIIYDSKTHATQWSHWKFSKDSLLQTKISPPQTVYTEIVGINSYTSSSFSHPVNDGTVGGVMNDIQFKLANLEALNKIIDKLNNDLVALGGIDDIEKTQMKAFIDATYKNNYEIMYDTLLCISMKKYFDDSTIKQYKEYEGYYKIHLENENK